ncbi:uncharacterized protein [Argopecten irradians]|uniref:uncharacterized protein n=1 Tax=Argopecten irradians TaxID=31199 RepID=UPI00370FB9B0
MALMKACGFLEWEETRVPREKPCDQESEIHNVLLRKMDMLANQNELILLKLDEVLAEKSKECTARINKSKKSMYQQKLSEAKNLHWTIKDRSGNSLKHNSNENSQMTEHILSFVKGMYPSAQNGVIMVSIERYFESLKQKEHKNLTEKTEHHKEKMMRYSRKKRKMTSRIAALNEKRSYSEEKKKKVREALRVDMMSSEEENISGDEACFLVKDIPWRSEEFSSIMKELDQKTINCRHQSQGGFM